MGLPNTPGESQESAEVPRGGSRIALWLIILGLGFLFLPLYLIASTIKETSANVQTDLESVQGTLSYTPPPNPTIEALNTTLAQISQQGSALDSLHATLEGININWPSVMATIGAYDPAHMKLTVISQVSTTITIGGDADSQNSVTAYADMLRTSELFEQVAVNSISIQTAPTPTPTPIPDATQETSSVTLVPVTAVPQTIAIFEISITMKAKTK